MANVKALVTLQKDGQTYLPGATITDVDDKEARALEKADKVEILAEEEAKPAPTGGNGQQGQGNGQGQGTPAKVVK